jgi:serine/threonine-protein kinase HipA
MFNRDNRSYRIVFNAWIGNTYNYTRNHGFFYNLDTQQCSLAPAFGVLPINNSRQQFLDLGLGRRYTTIENPMSQSLRFKIKPLKPKLIINQVSEFVIQ